MRASVWALGIASAVGTLAQPNPPDSDGDTVPDHTDVCPHTAGSPDNSGCPIDEEIVIVYGTRDSYSSVACPDGSTVTYYTDCPGFGNWDSYTKAYHDESTGAYSGVSDRVTVTVEEEDAEEEDPLAEHEFSDVDCDASITACWTPGDWYGFCTIFHADDDWMLPPQCRIGDANEIAAIEAYLMQLAYDHPRETCVIGVVGGLTYARFSKVKRNSDIAWAVSTAVGTGCYLWYMDDGED